MDAAIVKAMYMSGRTCRKTDERAGDVLSGHPTKHPLGKQVEQPSNLAGRFA
jgi:hypothetical protein